MKINCMFWCLTSCLLCSCCIVLRHPSDIEALHIHAYLRCVCLSLQRRFALERVMFLAATAGEGKTRDVQLVATSTSVYVCVLLTRATGDLRRLAFRIALRDGLSGSGM